VGLTTPHSKKFIVTKVAKGQSPQWAVVPMEEEEEHNMAIVF
jgi:hypothetical protein